MIISRGTKLGQSIVAVIFIVFYFLLIIAFIVSGNFNYLLIIVLSFVMFLPAFVYMSKFYDVAIEENYFILSNLFVHKKIEIELFSSVQPARNVMVVFVNPYFIVQFSNSKKYYFEKENSGKDIFRTRSAVAADITSEVVEYTRLWKMTSSASQE